MDTRNSNSFGTTQGCVNDDNMTYPFMSFAQDRIFIIADSLQSFGYQHGIQMQFSTRPA